ncbi:hypothetical protein JVU11DRAFT_11276 [Chiua virens]|nr:hypothetical protein JVU11DRAFT_11276 [Chiua virens]
MSDVLSIQHPPALRVGGRRLSINTRPKLHTTLGTAAPANTQPTEDADYPRPGATQGGGEEQAEAETNHPQNEEEVPKKQKKRGHGDHDQNKLRLKESVLRRLDLTTVPSKDHLSSRHWFGAAGRISQPAKALAV